jgi:hypothetical protein
MFSSNLLALNFGKTCLMQFVIKHSSRNVMNINTNNKIINTSAVKFLEIIINNTLSWKSYMNMITSKLSQVYYIVRAVKLFLPLDTLKIIYYAYFHSVMTCGVIFWGNSHTVTLFLDYKKELLEL